MAHEHVVYAILADGATLAKDTAAIQRYAPKLEELALRDDHRPYLAVAHRAWGVAHRLQTDFTSARSQLAQALDLFESFGARWQSGRTLFNMGELEAAKGESAAACGYFRRALEAFEEMKAEPAIARAEAALAACSAK
jgi:tetratricopeptide (TPR) repeat protein